MHSNSNTKLKDWIMEFIQNTKISANYSCRKMKKTKNKMSETKGKSKPETNSKPEVQPSEPEGFWFQ